MDTLTSSDTPHSIRNKEDACLYLLFSVLSFLCQLPVTTHSHRPPSILHVRQSTSLSLPITAVVVAKLSNRGGRLIISSDGIWDALSSEETAKSCRGLPVELVARQVVKNKDVDSIKSTTFAVGIWVPAISISQQSGLGFAQYLGSLRMTIRIANANRVRAFRNAGRR
ncbi:hypothetical protein ACLB2K_058971 [Fragaria x ananassa]